MAEKDFQSELMRGIRAAGGHAWKIPDMPHALQKQAHYRERKPYDCYWAFGNAWHALELKQVRTGLSLSLTELRDHQEAALLEVEAAGSHGWLVVNFRVRLSARQAAARGAEVLDRAFAARIGLVVSARVNEARTGLPLEWWEAHAVELPRVKSAGVLSWDPTPIATAGGGHGHDRCPYCPAREHDEGCPNGQVCAGSIA